MAISVRPISHHDQVSVFAHLGELRMRLIVSAAVLTVFVAAPVTGWYADGDMVRAAYTPHEQDDDWGQPGTMVREVLDDAARERLAGNIVGQLLNGVTEPVLERAFWYWKNVDSGLGEQVEKGVRAGQS